MLHRKELTRSPIQYLFVLREFVDGLLTRQLFDSLVFLFIPAGLAFIDSNVYTSCVNCITQKALIVYVLETKKAVQKQNLSAFAPLRNILKSAN
jgi:hypothetical protein